MLKHIYRAIFLVAIFAASLWYFGQNIKESVFHREETTVMSNATFPIVTIRNGKQNINLLHGYASNLDANLSRDAITILDDNQSLYVDIKENQSVVKKLNYELRDTFDNSLIENGSYSALDSNEDGKGTRIKINESLEQGKEYALKITVITAKSKKINFYTRVMANSTYHLDEKLDFVWQFHNAILDKSTVEQVESFIEPDRSLQNNSLSKVSIHSSLDLISFGSLKPEVISEVIPTIKEVSVDLASIMLDYYIKGYTEDGEEIYRVKEFYRVKYTPGRMYLLDYERTMEAEFQVDLMSLSQSEFKFGIANPENIPVYIDSGKKNLCFVRNGELWYYSVDSNRVVKIFSFRQKETDYIRDAYDQHEIKVLNVNVEGDVDFVVYGYMNRGLYEGRVGIVLYRYSASNNRIEELVYIPSNEPYQILKEKMGDFAYLNYNDVYYFLLNQTIYSYNIVTKGLTELATGITKDDYIFSKEKSYLAWQELDKNGYADKITIMHLESGRVDTINAEANDNIRLLGTIDNNIIYGISHNKNGYVDVNGQTIIPMHKVLIADDTCKVLKTYEKKGYYTINVSVSDNVIRLDRQKRSENGFVNIPQNEIGFRRILCNFFPGKQQSHSAVEQQTARFRKRQFLCRVFRKIFCKQIFPANQTVSPFQFLHHQPFRVVFYIINAHNTAEININLQFIFVLFCNLFQQFFRMITIFPGKYKEIKIIVKNSVFLILPYTAIASAVTAAQNDAKPCAGKGFFHFRKHSFQQLFGSGIAAGCKVFMIVSVPHKSQIPVFPGSAGLPAKPENMNSDNDNNNHKYAVVPVYSAIRKFLPSEIQRVHLRDDSSPILSGKTIPPSSPDNGPWKVSSTNENFYESDKTAGSANKELPEIPQGTEQYNVPTTAKAMQNGFEPVKMRN